MTLNVNDKDGGSTTDTLEVTVNNLDPTITQITGDTNIDEGAITSFNATATDSGNDTLTYTWDFGDGSPSVTSDQSSVTHTYTDGGIYTVTLTISDERGGSTTDTLQVTVNNLPTTVAANNRSITIDEGARAINSGSFSDVGDDTQTMIVTASDEDGGVTTTTFDLTVNDVTPSLSNDNASVRVSVVSIFDNSDGSTSNGSEFEPFTRISPGEVVTDEYIPTPYRTSQVAIALEDTDVEVDVYEDLFYPTPFSKIEYTLFYRVGSTHVDQLMVNFPSGNPIPTSPVRFDGAGGSDTRELVRGDFPQIPHNFTSLVHFVNEVANEVASLVLQAVRSNTPFRSVNGINLGQIPHRLYGARNQLESESLSYFSPIPYFHRDIYLNAEEGDDNIYGWASLFRLLMVGGKGKDPLKGVRGTDVIRIGTGSDTIFGSPDQLFGELGNDSMAGGTPRNKLLADVEQIIRAFKVHDSKVANADNYNWDTHMVLLDLVAPNVRRFDYGG